MGENEISGNHSGDEGRRQDKEVEIQRAVYACRTTTCMQLWIWDILLLDP